MDVPTGIAIVLTVLATVEMTVTGAYGVWLLVALAQ
jgi:hypothetical protein